MNKACLSPTSIDRFVSRLPAESTPNVPASKVKTRKHDKAYLARCICAMSKDRAEQINDRIPDNRFPLQMDKSTDSNGDFAVNTHGFHWRWVFEAGSAFPQTSKKQNRQMKCLKSLPPTWKRPIWNGRAVWGFCTDAAQAVAWKTKRPEGFFPLMCCGHAAWYTKILCQTTCKLDFFFLRYGVILLIFYWVSFIFFNGVMVCGFYYHLNDRNKVIQMIKWTGKPFIWTSHSNFCTYLYTYLFIIGKSITWSVITLIHY